MKTTEIVLSHTKIMIALAGLKLIKPAIDTAKAHHSIQRAIDKLSDQAVKSFGKFDITLSDSAYIAMGVHFMYRINKAQILSDGSQSGHAIYRDLKSLSDTFTEAYMELVDNAEEGLSFRKCFCISQL